MTQATANTATTPPAKSGLPTAILLLATLGVAMSQTIVLAALPVFGRQMHVDATAATWLLTVFMLASAVATPIAGRLGDLHGHRRVMVAGLLVLAAGSLVAGISDLTGWFPGLLLGRALQGCSGGVFPVVFGLARASLPQAKLHGVVAALSAMFGVGGALGMVAAGPLVDLAGTSALFWLGLIIAVIALLGAPLLQDDRPQHQPGERTRLDLGGAILLAGTVVTLLLGISQGRTWGWSSAATLGMFAAAIVCGIVFVIVERRVSAPIVHLDLLVRPALAGTNIATVVISVGMFAAVTLIPQFAQTPTATGYGLGYTATQTGLVFIPTAALMVIAAPLATRIAARTSSKVAFLIGSALACAALLLFGLVHQHAWEFFVAAGVLGLAYGLVFASLGGLVVGAVEHSQTGAATGLNTILRTLGGALGAQLAAVIVTGSIPDDGTAPTVNGYTIAFLVSAAVALVALVAATTIRSQHRHPEPNTATAPVETGSIVVGVDGSPSSIAALREAHRLSASLSTPLKVMTVWHVPASADAYEFGTDEMDDETTEARNVQQRAMQEAFGEQQPTDYESIVTEGDSAAILIDESEAASMLVVGSRGHGGVAGLLLGSVSSACAEHAKCPVLVVH